MRDRSRRRWFENAIIYTLDVATFADGNGDGIGDFRGLTDRLDYLSGLGIDTLWLLPFYRSPNRDNRYDITDHLAVDPDLGDVGDVTRFFRECDQRGIRVIIELVVNHTSIDHPWFREARSDPSSPRRDFYVWRDGAPEHLRDFTVPVFPGVEHGIWTYDEQAGAEYLHRFYAFQPELNIANPDVRDEIAKIIEHWLQLGAAGFRLDAAPYIVQKAGWADDVDDGFWYVHQLRELVATYGDDAVLLAEADVEPEHYADFFASGAGINVLLNFWGNNHLFLALAREDPGPLISACHRTPSAPGGASYANWVRNHDELDLERLSDAERNEVLDRFAPDPDARIYGRGIRRRLPPMVDGDRAVVELAHALTFALPGIPIVRYGEEIGMGDDPDLPEREAVRTAMQWSPERSAGFSDAALDRLQVTVVTESAFTPQRVNVADQRSDASSLLNSMHTLIRARRESPEIGTGIFQVLEELASHCVFGVRYDGERDVTVMVHNLSSAAARVPVKALDELSAVAELAADRDYPLPSADHVVEIAPHGYRWLRGRRGPT